MAKQVGTIRLNGTIDGINYYSSSNGGDLARAAGGGYGSESVKKSSAMTRPQENAREFGRSSSVKKKFRIALAPFLGVRKDGALHGRMVKLFMHLKKLDLVSSRGNRKVALGVTTPKGIDLLSKFEFTPACKVIDILGATLDYDFDTRTLDITNFDINNVGFPSGATHMALTLGLLHFDFESLTYKLKTTAPLYLDKTYPGNSLMMNVALPEVTGTEVAVLGMKFYEEVAQKYYLFNSGNAVGIEVLGVRGEG